MTTTAKLPKIQSVKPSTQTTYRYWILVDADGERVCSHRSFDTRKQAASYVARNFGGEE